ncbi:Uncharacterised protein [uncultured archaeon]|nr:Uncharacterised protein [uncultured archaeon]
MLKDADEFYKPLIKEDVKIDGIAAETVESGKVGKMLQRAFITSDSDDFRYITNLVKFFVGPQDLNSMNNLLVIIKKDNKAKIYTKFPLILEVRARQVIKKGTAVTKTNLVDIGAIGFFDSVYGVSIEEGDKILWLFRVGWRFGSYFDFTGKMIPSETFKQMGENYRRLLYCDLYNFLHDKTNFNMLLLDGWFPFVQILDERFDKLIEYYSQDQKYSLYLNQLIEEFTKEKIGSFVKYWWQNPVFNAKKEIIEAGIAAFLENTKYGDICCVKTLLTEIEGIVRYSSFNEDGKDPSKQNQVKDYVVKKGLEKFSSIDSLGFPKEFYEYLTQVVFSSFNIKENEIPTSRHSVAHGIAKSENYNRARALQAILILDQIYFFLGKSNPSK